MLGPRAPLTFYLSLVRPGELRDMWGGTLTFKTDAIRSASWEKSSGIWYFDRGKFQEVGESD